VRTCLTAKWLYGWIATRSCIPVLYSLRSSGTCTGSCYAGGSARPHRYDAAHSHPRPHSRERTPPRARSSLRLQRNLRAVADTSAAPLSTHSGLSDFASCCCFFSSRASNFANSSRAMSSSSSRTYGDQQVVPHSTLHTPHSTLHTPERGFWTGSSILQPRSRLS
jgi:hypothetical protein